MTITTTTRQSTDDETVREMDRRGAVIETLEARIAVLEAALKPFASDELHEGLDDGPDDKTTTWPRFRLGDFRSARAALKPKEPS